MKSSRPRSPVTSSYHVLSVVFTLILCRSPLLKISLLRFGPDFQPPDQNAPRLHPSLAYSLRYVYSAVRSWRTLNAPLALYATSALFRNSDKIRPDIHQPHCLLFGFKNLNTLKLKDKNYAARNRDNSTTPQSNARRNGATAI
uniref:Uncharacterized protein n=1 Tax=Ananas comosus var. bracteatus TaxID=296719 RepID=A0A6V7PV09_ANACO|nr:unnamed protein product [Ananas comosus var. bracteatus]